MPSGPPSHILGDHPQGSSLARWRPCSVGATGIAKALRHLRLEILHVVPVRLGHHPVSARKCRESSHRQHPVEVFPLYRSGSVTKGAFRKTFRKALQKTLRKALQPGVTEGFIKGATKSVSMTKNVTKIQWSGPVTKTRSERRYGKRYKNIYRRHYKKTLQRGVAKLQKKSGPVIKDVAKGVRYKGRY